MKPILTKIAVALLGTVLPLAFTSCGNDPVTHMNASSTNAQQLAAKSRTALNQLYQTNPKARKLTERAQGVLVFPEITKAGLLFGGMAGNGALLRRNGSVAGYYQTTGASYGLQAGIQTYAYALFLMDQSAFDNINRNKGWELGGSPSLVVIDQGVAGSLSTTTLNASTYAVFFNQKGLMGGIGLQGTKITRIQPGR